MRRTEKWDSGFLAVDGSGLTYAMAWAAAGGTREHPKPYVVCPWEPRGVNPQPPYEWDVFPDGFGGKLKKFTREDVVRPFCRIPKRVAARCRRASTTALSRISASINAGV
jgi:hypothetical protein